MNDNEVYSTIIEWMISEAENKEYIEKLNVILLKIKGKKSIEEDEHPRFNSLMIFGFNIFPFSIEQYREMTKLLKDTANE